MFETIKQQWHENPLYVVTAVGVAAASVATLLNAVSAAQGRHAYAKQVNYRVKNSR
jgi:hypothetical protein